LRIELERPESDIVNGTRTSKKKRKKSRESKIIKLLEENSFVEVSFVYIIIITNTKNN